ncbi:MAG TPA: hemerythrin domain-containing protein [Kofleriaceae bacterium]|nr:hemerythrin domain-containing protein [Kofleriaceae bacterium]
MHDRDLRWDDRLSTVEAWIRQDNGDAALAHLLAFDAELTRDVQGEEHVVLPVLERLVAVPAHATATMREEHRQLRRLVDTAGERIARRDSRGGLEVLSTLRSLLLVHVLKEEWVVYPLMRTYS